MVAGEVLIYAIAVPWLAVALHVTLFKAVTLGMTPFIAGDLIKAGLAGIALPSSWHLVDQMKKD